MQHRQVVRGQMAATSAHRVLQLRLLADLDGAQPARLDHRQQLTRTRRLGGSPGQQQITQREEKIGRPAPVRHLALRQVEGGFKPAQLLQREQRSQNQVVTPCRTRVAALQRVRVVRLGSSELRAQLQILAELVAQISVLRLRLQCQAQQVFIAPALGGHLRIQVAIVRNHQGQAAPRQHRLRLLMHPARIAHTVRQHARQPARCLPHAAIGTIEIAGHADLADEAGRLRAQCRQRLAALGDPFIGVEHQAPGRIGQRQRGVARGGEVVGPIEVRHACAAALGDGGGRVDRTGVEHPHRVDPGAGAEQATLDAARFVANDHDQGNRVHGGGHPDGLW